MTMTYTKNGSVVIYYTPVDITRGFARRATYKPVNTYHLAKYEKSRSHVRLPRYRATE